MFLDRHKIAFCLWCSQTFFQAKPECLWTRTRGHL